VSARRWVFLAAGRCTSVIGTFTRGRYSHLLKGYRDLLWCVRTGECGDAGPGGRHTGNCTPPGMPCIYAPCFSQSMIVRQVAVPIIDAHSGVPGAVSERAISYAPDSYFRAHCMGMMYLTGR
jgi:hypothetical protein